VLLVDGCPSLLCRRCHLDLNPSRNLALPLEHVLSLFKDRNSRKRIGVPIGLLVSDAETLQPWVLVSPFFQAVEAVEVLVSVVEEEAGVVAAAAAEVLVAVVVVVVVVEEEEEEAAGVVAVAAVAAVVESSVNT
jgi:hypothetical protein